MAQVPQKSARQSGFTLVELLIVLAIIGMLFTISAINLGRVNEVASESSTVNTLLADLKSQQLLAMAGDTGGSGSQQEHGVHIEPTAYTLFAGSSYDPGNSDNFTVKIGANLTLTSTFPDNAVVFSKGDGAVADFTGGANTITVSGSGDNQIITINRFGATAFN